MLDAFLLVSARQLRGIILRVFGVDDPKSENVRVIRLVDGNAAGAWHFAGLEWKNNRAIIGHVQALIGDGDDAAIERLGDDELADKLNGELHGESDTLQRLQPVLGEIDSLLRRLEDGVIAVIDRGAERARGDWLRPTVLALRAPRVKK